MSDSSDSDDDDVQMQKFLQAADTTLLTNAMFQQSIEKNDENGSTSPKTTIPQPAAPALNTNGGETTVAPKSERYLEEDEFNNNENNFRISKEIQSHVWRKLTAIISEQVEFCDKHQIDQLKYDTIKNKKKVDKSKVRLLQDADCYVKADEDLVETPLVKQVKPRIQRRQIDDDKVPISKEILSSLAVSGAYIQAGSDTRTWAPRPNRLHKVFQYTTTTSKRGVLHSRQPENEFSELRRKRQWHSNQIKQRIKTK